MLGRLRSPLVDLPYRVGYRAGVTTSELGRLQRGLLLCALALGVVGMHQLVTTDAMPGMAMPVMSSSPAMDMGDVTTVTAIAAEDHQHGGQGVVHDLMHLCLAVLCAAGAALLAFWLIRRCLAVVSPSSRAVARAPDRPPKAGGRLLLASVCVLRL